MSYKRKIRIAEQSTPEEIIEPTPVIEPTYVCKTLDQIDACINNKKLKFLVDEIITLTETQYQRLKHLVDIIK
jgi:hypothetical protein